MLAWSHCAIATAKGLDSLSVKWACIIFFQAQARPVLFFLLNRSVFDFSTAAKVKASHFTLKPILPEEKMGRWYLVVEKEKL